MIRLATEPYQDFIDYLNSLELTDKFCDIVILPTYTSVGDLDIEDSIGYAVYLPNELLIYVAGYMEGIMSEINEDLECKDDEKVTKDEVYKYILQSIGHEYKHHLQNINNQNFNEDEAEEFGREIVREYLKERNGDEN